MVDERPAELRQQGRLWRAAESCVRRSPGQAAGRLLATERGRWESLRQRRVVGTMAEAGAKKTKVLKTEVRRLARPASLAVLAMTRQGRQRAGWAGKKGPALPLRADRLG